MRSWGNAQQLISPGNGGIVDGLNIDVMATHHDVTHLRVFLSVRNLIIPKRHTHDENRAVVTLSAFQVPHDQFNRRLPGQG